MRDNDDNEALLPNPAPAPAAQKLHWPFTAKHPNCAECDREYEPPHENCGECERDAAPATEVASPPEPPPVEAPERISINPATAARHPVSDKRIGDVEYVLASRPAQADAVKPLPPCPHWDEPPSGTAIELLDKMARSLASFTSDVPVTPKIRETWSYFWKLDARLRIPEASRPAQEQARLRDEPQTHLEVIRERVADDYRTIPQPDHGAMLADLRVLLAEVDRLSLTEEFARHLMARHEELAKQVAAPPSEQARELIDREATAAMFHELFNCYTASKLHAQSEGEREEFLRLKGMADAFQSAEQRIRELRAFSAAPQGAFSAGVAACVEKVKDAALGYRSPTSGMVGMEVRDALWAVAGKLESLTDSAAKETE